MSESDLVKGLRQHDRSALLYLYDHYSPALFGLITRIVKNESIAEEVLQDVFVKIWDRIASYDPNKGRLFTWIVNIARNQAIDRGRSKEIKKEKRTGDIENFVNVIDRQDYAEQRVETIGLAEILKKLPEEQRFIVDQLYLKGYSQSEVAEEFNIPLGTVKTRLRLAMQALRTSLGIK